MVGEEWGQNHPPPSQCQVTTTCPRGEKNQTGGVCCTSCGRQQREANSASVRADALPNLAPSLNCQSIKTQFHFCTADATFDLRVLKKINEFICRVKGQPKPARLVLNINRIFLPHRAGRWDNTKILGGKRWIEDFAICQSTNWTCLSSSGFPSSSLQVIICLAAWLGSSGQCKAI